MNANILGGVALMVRGLVAAETGAYHGHDQWRLCDVGGTAFGPVQLNLITMREIIRRNLLVEEDARDCLLAIYEHNNKGLSPGEVWVPPLEWRRAYWMAVAGYLKDLLARSGGDLELAAAYWHYGRGAANDYGSVQELMVFFQQDDPGYLDRFRGGI